MSHAFRKNLLIALVCSAVLYLLFFLSAAPSGAVADTGAAALNQAEAAGTQLLWESLSHQFVSTVPY